MKTRREEDSFPCAEIWDQGREGYHVDMEQSGLASLDPADLKSMFTDWMNSPDTSPNCVFYK